MAKITVAVADEPLLTPAEAAARFRVDPKTVTRWAQQGRIHSTKTPGGHRRYYENEVNAKLRGETYQPAGGWPAAIAQICAA